MIHPIDWVVVAAYFGLIVFIGYRTGRGNVGIEDFFLAKRSMPWYAIGLSVMATQASAITPSRSRPSNPSGPRRNVRPPSHPTTASAIREIPANS